MVWQDIVVSIANMFMGYALVPQVIFGFKKKKKTITPQTSLITFIALASIVFCYLSLDLYFSTIVGGITAGLWLTLFIQSLYYK